MKPPRARRLELSIRLAALVLALGAGASFLQAGEPPRTDPDPLALLDSMARASGTLRDYTMVLVKQERRLEGLEPEQRLLVKWARPHRVYFKSLDGEAKGQEVLFVSGWNRNRARAHKGSFPDVTANLDPRGSWAMAHTHHPVTETSIARLVALIVGGAKEAEKRGEGTIRLLDRKTVLGRPALGIEMTSPPEGEIHVVKKGETLWSVAEQGRSDMFVLLYRNRDKGYRGPRDARPGDAVFVPRYYAGRVELWIDDETRLPLSVKIYAHDGALFERYEHHDLKANVGLRDLDFDPENPAYDF